MFRLALQNKGEVPIARLFLELPFSLREIEENGDLVADGNAVVKNEWGEFLTYEFPELANVPTSVFDSCPTCGNDGPSAITEGGVQVSAPLLCDSCYRSLKLKRKQNEEGRLERLKEWFFKNEEETDPIELAELEHEIFFLAARLGDQQFTHTAIAAQSRHASGKLKQRLDRMAGRRYIHVGLLPSGDTVGYRLPPGITYPKATYGRLRNEMNPLNQPKPRVRVTQASRVATPRPVANPGIKIVIKDSRSRTRNPSPPPPPQSPPSLPRDLGPVD